MFARVIVALLMTSVACLLVGCGTSIYNLKIPLGENSAAVADSPRVSIDDVRPRTDRIPHRAKDVVSCERWFGDDTFLPSKLVYLDKRVAERTAFNMNVHIRLTRFYVIEYCEQSVSGNATASARTAGGLIPQFTPAPINGDTVVLRLAGEINGMPFDESRRFDYGTLYKFSQPPSANPTYRALLRSKLEEIVDAMVNKVWRTESMQRGKATH
ncbi:MAG TPA: hypothetical protein VFS58_10715 [Steroidobacteraceae bacterium]|nr:hypothetical protein [Steroidobacteraceae bacterium]